LHVQTLKLLVRPLDEEESTEVRVKRRAVFHSTRPGPRACQLSVLLQVSAEAIEKQRDSEIDRSKCAQNLRKVKSQTKTTASEPQVPVDD
jgi:hypothetical protein